MPSSSPRSTPPSKTSPPLSPLTTLAIAHPQGPRRPLHRPRRPRTPPQPVRPHPIRARRRRLRQHLYLLTYHDPAMDGPPRRAPRPPAAPRRRRQSPRNRLHHRPRPTAAFDYFNVAEHLAHWNLLTEARTFAEQGVKALRRQPPHRSTPPSTYPANPLLKRRHLRPHPHPPRPGRPKPSPPWYRLAKLLRPPSSTRAPVAASTRAAVAAELARQEASPDDEAKSVPRKSGRATSAARLADHQPQRRRQCHRRQPSRPTTLPSKNSPYAHHARPPSTPPPPDLALDPPPPPPASPTAKPPGANRLLLTGSTSPWRPPNCSPTPPSSNTACNSPSSPKPLEAYAARLKPAERRPPSASKPRKPTATPATAPAKPASKPSSPSA